VLVADTLAERSWPPSVSVEDISYNPIAFVQRLDDEPADSSFELLVVVAAVARAGRSPGAITVYRWDGALPDEDQIQEAVAEAVTGVISLDNTLVVTRYFVRRPPSFVIVEVEPEVHEFGEALSDAVLPSFERACDAAATIAVNPGMAATLPEAPLGGGALMGRSSSAPRLSDATTRFG
jgi:hydrogenase maturation protease